MPVILLMATDAFIASSIPGNSRISAKSVSPNNAYMEWTSPPNFLMRFFALSVRAALIPFIASPE